MSLTQYYTATTLDGFIADPDNSLDWLFTRKQDPDGPMNYEEYIPTSGRWRWGRRRTMDPRPRVRGQGSGGLEVAVRDPVLGLHPPPADRRSGGAIEFTSADVASVHKEMVEAAGDRNVWIVGGGDLVGQFADAGLLDEVIVAIAPVTLGGGAPLLPRRIELQLDEWDATATSPAPGTPSCTHPPDHRVSSQRL